MLRRARAFGAVRRCKIDRQPGGAVSAHRVSPVERRGARVACAGLSSTLIMASAIARFWPGDRPANWPPGAVGLAQRLRAGVVCLGLSAWGLLAGVVFRVLALHVGLMWFGPRGVRVVTTRRAQKTRLQRRSMTGAASIFACAADLKVTAVRAPV